MASNQGKEASSRRSSLIGLSGVFANKFSLWETRTSGEAGAGADQDAPLPQTTRSGSFGGKMRRLLSPKVSRTHRHPAPFGPDDPSSDILAGADADLSHGSGAGQLGSPFTRDTEVARSWPVTPASNSKSLWKKLVDKGAAGRAGHTPIAAMGSRYDSPHRSPGADSDTHGSEQAVEDEMCGDGDSYYSYSPAQGMRLMARYSEEEGEECEERGEQGRMRRLQEPQEMEATVDLMTHALGMGSTSQDTPVHGLQSLDSADLTPGFMDFANKVCAHITLDEADDFLRPAVDDTTVLLVPGTALAWAGAYGYDESPLFVPSAGASRNASRASPQPGAEAAGGGVVTSPPSLTAFVSSMLHGQGSDAAARMRSPATQAEGEQLPVDASEVQLQVEAERDNTRSPSMPPDDFYGIEGQTTELNLRGRWGDDMTATSLPVASQGPDVTRRLSGSEVEQEGDGSTDTPAAAAAMSAEQQEEAAVVDAAPAEVAAPPEATVEQLGAAEAASPAAVQEALQLPAAVDLTEQPGAAAAVTDGLSPVHVLTVSEELPAAADVPVSSPAREATPDVTAMDGAFGTPIATEPQPEHAELTITTSAPASATDSPAAPAITAAADAPQNIASGEPAAAAAAVTTDEGAVLTPAAAGPTPMDAASGDDDISDAAPDSAPASLRAHMISAEASQIDTEGEASEATSSLTSPTEGAMFSMDVDMPDAPAEEVVAAASAAQSPAAAEAEAAVAEPTAEAEEQAEDGSVHVATASPAGKDSPVQQQAQPAVSEEFAGLPASPAAAVEAAYSQPTKPTTEQVDVAAEGVEDSAVVPEQQQLQPDNAQAEGEAPLAMKSADAVEQVDQQQAVEQVQAPMQEELAQQDGAPAEAAANEPLVQYSEQAEEDALTQAPHAVAQPAEEAEPQQHSLGTDESAQAGGMAAVAAEQRGGLSAEASQEDMALMADATDVPLQLEDSMEAFPGLQSTASPELPGGATDTDNDADPFSPTLDFQALSHATHATPFPIAAAPPSRRDQLRRSIPLFDAGEGDSLIEDSNSNSSGGNASAVAGNAAGASARRLSGARQGGDAGAVRASIPLFVRPDQQLSGGLGLDDEKLEDLAPFRNYSSHGGGGGGGPRQGGVSSGAAAAGFVSSLAPVEEGSLDSPLGSEQSPTIALRHSPMSAPNSGSASRSRALRSSASPDLQLGSPPQLHRLGGGGGSPSKFSPARMAAQAGSGSATQPAAVGGRPSPTKGAAHTRSAFKATAAALAAAGITPGLAPSPTFGAPTLQPLSAQAPSSGNTTPSLLDRTAASPSQVYHANPASMETPYRQMAALPMQAALAAPLIDNSPFRLGEDAMDTICLADEAQRVLQSLAGGAGMGSGDLGNETMTLLQGHEGLDSPVASTGPSPSARLREMHVQMLTRQLTDAEARLHDVEAQNESLKDQLAALQFEKNAAESNDEFEREARLYAEEQLEQARAEIAQLEGAVAALRRQVTEAGEAAAVAAAVRSAESAAWEEERGNLQLRLDEVQVERDSALDTINLHDVRLTALNSNIADLQAALSEEQGRQAVLERAVANKEGEAREMARSASEARSQLERAMEQLIAAQTGNEHASRRASDDAARIAALTTQLQSMAVDQARTAGDVALLKQKYAHKSAALKEALHKLASKDAECAELMAMCDQLLAQQEAGRGTEDTAGVMDQAA